MWGITLLALAPLQDPALEAARLEHFEARIRPVLVEHCYACHNSADDDRGGLALDHRAGIRAESDSGTAVVPGDPENSLLLRVLRHELVGLEMPEDGPRLDEAVIADFERWIREGAVDPRDAPPSEEELDALTSWEAQRARRAEWWCWQPVADPEPPQGDGWSEHPVDRFLAREQERLGLERASPADRRALIRRLHFVLTGLPPSPQEVDSFVGDRSPEAFEREVDRLLASPGFGERWARHWMDLVRYADSHGSEGDPRIPNAWRYRDYLVRAFNADLAYDQLVREHVAGDLLPEPRVNEELELVESALGAAHWRLVFHGFTPTDALEEKVRFVDDQINVLGKTFLAQTISCARCHDHKFDPIGQEDYTALYGVLASNRPVVQDVNTPEVKDRHKVELAALKQELRGELARVWLEQLDARLEERPALEGEAPGDASSVEEQTLRRWDLAGADGLADWFLAGNGLADGHSRAGAFALEAGGERVLRGIYPAGVYSHLLSTRHRGVLQSRRFDVRGETELWFRAIGGGSSTLRFCVHDYPRQGTVFPMTELKDERWAWHRLDLSYWEGDVAHLELVTGQDAPVERRGGERSWFGLREVLLLPKGAGPPPEPADPLAGGLGRGELRGALNAWRQGSADDRQARLLDAALGAGLLANSLAELPELRELVDAYRTLEAEVPLPTRAPGLLEGEVLDAPLFHRGDHRRPLQPVPRRFLAVLDDEAYGAAGSGRLELAEDLVGADNPLTARVAVNRLWHHLFGRGIVATPDNFGRLGVEPTHPELLDHLATRFVRRGWSLKDTIRYLVTSKSWQLASAPAPGMEGRDPDNRWLARAPLRRLDAESLRDALFATAGLLEEELPGASGFGPGFAPGSATARRSVYVRNQRNGMDPFLEAFDAPVPFATTGARPTTQVPAQALELLNGTLARTVAERWGERVARRVAERDGRASDRDELSAMFHTALGREPGAGELEALAVYAEGVRSEALALGEERALLERRVALDEAAIEELVAPVRARLARGAGETAGVESPRPLARWVFAEGLADTVGELDARLHGSARLVPAGLLLDGGGHASTDVLPVELGAKTLEAWVRLADLEQRGGGVLTVQGLEGELFDAIVFGEETPRHWIAGSNNFQRTRFVDGGPEERALHEPVHLAIAHDADGTVRVYRDGVPYGAPYRQGEPLVFEPQGSRVLFGLRHGRPTPDRRLRGVLHEARLYDRALTEEEVAASAASGTHPTRAGVLLELDEDQREELGRLEQRLADARAELASSAVPATETEVWTRVAQALFNLKEFRYLP